MSLKGDKYETAEEITARLLNSVVIYDGQLVHINDVSLPGAVDGKEIARVHFTPLPLKGDKPVRKYLSSRKFDLTPFKMGYLNYYGRAILFVRKPARQYKQGLCSANVSAYEITGQSLNRAAVEDILNGQALVDLYNNKYPSFESVAEFKNKEISSVALSKNFAVAFDHDLEVMFLYRGTTKCGLAFRGDKTIRVPEKFKYLREELVADNIPVA